MIDRPQAPCSRLWALASRAALLGAALVGAAASTSSAEPLRVASLVPFVAEVHALIPDDLDLVGTVRRNIHAPVPEGVTDLGNPHEPNGERLAALAPDVIVVDRMLHQRMTGRLEASGAELLSIDTTSVDSTLAGLVELGRRAGNAAPVEQAAERARASIASAQLETPAKALIIFATPGSPMVVTGQTWVGDLLAQSGFENIADPLLDRVPPGRFPGFLQISDELLASARPDVILLLAHGDPRAVEAAFRARLEEGAWKAVADAARGRVVVLPPSHFSSNPGLAMADAARAVVAAVSSSPAVSAGPE